MPQGQKDFLALSHGQEWVAFYESFDKLVQDNLARSSELLRRAMSLPEVADREVQQVRTELEGKLAAEKARQKEMLSGLQADLTGSYRQVSSLAQTVGVVIGDIERLSQRLNEMIASFNEESALEAELIAETHALNGNSSTAQVPESLSHLVAQAPAETPVFDETEAPAAELDNFEMPSMEDSPAPINVDEISAAVQEQQAMLDAAEAKIGELESSIDLSAMAEAETDAPAEDASAAAEDDAADAAGGEQRPRPHWLSVTRAGSRA